jgi:hypothetical protein
MKTIIMKNLNCGLSDGPKKDVLEPFLPYERHGRI